MRLFNLILNDIKLQIKYGFYLLYAILTIVYIIFLVLMPNSWYNKAILVFIFSDPASMGVFFMGAIILLEKSQKIHSAFSVSPILIKEYIISKVISLSIISNVSAAILGFFSENSLFFIILGTFLTSLITTLISIIIASKINSLNEFLVNIIPIEILLFIPAYFYLFKTNKNILLEYYPTNICLDIMACKNINFIKIAILILTIIILLLTAKMFVKKMIKRIGGEIKL